MGEEEEEHEEGDVNSQDGTADTLFSDRILRMGWSNLDLEGEEEEKRKRKKRTTKVRKFLRMRQTSSRLC